MSYCLGYDSVSIITEKTNKDRVEEIIKSIVDETLAEITAVIPDYSNEEYSNIYNDIIEFLDATIDDEYDEEETRGHLEECIKPQPTLNENKERVWEINVRWNTDENVEGAYLLLSKNAVKHSIHQYSTGFSGYNDSREGAGGQTFFLGKNGDVVWAEDLAKKHLN